MSSGSNQEKSEDQQNRADSFSDLEIGWVESQLIPEGFLEPESDPRSQEPSSQVDMPPIQPSSISQEEEEDDDTISPIPTPPEEVPELPQSNAITLGETQINNGNMDLKNAPGVVGT